MQPCLCVATTSTHKPAIIVGVIMAITMASMASNTSNPPHAPPFQPAASAFQWPIVVGLASAHIDIRARYSTSMPVLC